MMRRGYRESALEAARKRAANIKDRLLIPRLAEIREAHIVAVRGGHEADCPACGAAQTGGQAVSIGRSGRTYKCGTCGATGDVITFEMAATGKDFKSACADLEALLETPLDAQTGELFAGGAS
jgi:predicted RNA-binding Zn-ribbon protein involved in translation (DUF1610 family)